MAPPSLAEVGMEGFKLLDDMKITRPPPAYSYNAQYHHQPRHAQGAQAGPRWKVEQTGPRKGAMNSNEAAILYGGVFLGSKRQIIDCDEAVILYGGVLVKDKLVEWTNMVPSNYKFHH